MDRKSDFKEMERCSELLKVLGHPIRLCITKGLWEEGEKKVGEMQDCLELPQSTVSQHLNTLKMAGIIEGVRHGKEVNYHICHDEVVDLLGVLFKEKE